MRGRSLIFCILFIFFVSLKAQADIIFSASFDTSVKAEKSGGNPDPIIEVDKYRLVPGIAGQAVLVTPETPLAYHAEGNISTVAGSISFWISPQNWDKSRQGMVPLFWLGTERGFSLYCYAYYHSTTGGYLSFRWRLNPYKTEENYIQDFTFAKKPEVLAKDEWTHFVFTWTNWQFCMYVNGEEAGRFNFPLPVEPHQIRSNDYIWIAVGQFWKSDRDIISKVDELQIYDRALTADEVKEIYFRYSPKLISKESSFAIPVPMKSVNVSIDGKLTPGEWDDATKIPITNIFHQGRFISITAWCYIKYDENNLYVAFEVEYKDDLITPAKGRSTDVFSGDEAEIIIRPPDMQKPDSPFYQFAVAPNGAYAYQFGTMADPKRWEWEAGFKHATSIEVDRWFAEMLIPFADMKVHPSPQIPWLFQAGLHRPSMESLGGIFERWISFSPGKNMFHTVESMAKMFFQPDDTAIRIEKIENLNAGRISLTLSSPGKNPVETKIIIKTPKKEILNKEIFLSSGHNETIFSNEKILGEGILTVEALYQGRASPLFSYTTRFYVKNPLCFEYVIYASLREIEFKLDMSGLPDNLLKKLLKGGLQGEAVVVSAKEGKEYGKTSFVPQSVNESVKMGFSEMPPGDYILRVSISDGIDKIMSSSVFTRPDPSFLTKRAGIDRTVPPPWSPVEVSGNKIKVWGREYYSKEGPFFSSIRSNGKEVIKRSPEFYIICAGKKYFFKPVREVVIEKGEDKVVTSGISRLDNQGMSLEMEWTRTVEFDGFIRIDIKIIPVGGEQSIDGMMLDIFVEEEAAKNLLIFREAKFSPYIEESWVEKRESFAEPGKSIFLTGDFAGIEFATDTDANWVYKEGEKPIKIYMDGKNAVIRCSIINKSVSLEKPLTYTFVFMPTPVRPLRKDWRSVHADGWGHGKEGRQKLQSYFIYSPHQGIQWPNVALLTDMLDDKAGFAEIEAWRKKGIEVVPYTLLSQMPDTNPYYDYYGGDWAATKEGKSLPKSYLTDFPWLKVPGKPFYLCAPVCVASGFGDFLAWSIDHIMSKYHFVGVYFDGGDASYCDNPRHGCQKIDAFGRKAKTYNNLATREIFKRIYKIIHKYNPNGYLWVHTGLSRRPHIQSFIDLQTMGEEYMNIAPVNPNIYTDDKYALLKWQVNYNSHITGIPIIFLPQSCPRTENITLPPKNIKRDRPVVTMSMLHDVPLTGNWIYPPTVEETWRIADETNLTEAEFTGYWLNKEIIPDNKNILVSYYTWKGENKVLLILGNPTPEKQETRLSFNPPFNGKVMTAVNLRTKTPISFNNPIIVEDRDFQAILVSW